MAEVYWIHLAEHTDMFSQGYIGFTTKTSEERFKQHLTEMTYSRSKKRKSHLHKSITKYGVDKIICKTIIIGDNEYCLDVEYKLRPEKDIGWNMATGGGLPPGVKGLPVSEETRKKIGDAHKGRIVSDETRKKLSDSLKGKPCSDERKERLRLLFTGRKCPRKPGQQERLTESVKEYYRNREWWMTSNTAMRPDLAPLADVYEYLVKTYPNNTIREYCASICVEYDYLKEKLVKRIKDGWSPATSHYWNNTFKQNDLSIINHSVFKNGFVSRKPWAGPTSDPSVWVNAQYFGYLISLYGKKSVAKAYFNRGDKLDSLAKCLEKGWKPSEDQRWVDRREGYLLKEKESEQ